MLRLNELAKVREGFEDKIETGRWRGRRAVQLTLLKTPEQDAIDIAETVKSYVAERPTRLGGAVQVETVR